MGVDRINHYASRSYVQGNKERLRHEKVFQQGTIADLGGAARTRDISQKLHKRSVPQLQNMRKNVTVAMERSKPHSKREEKLLALESLMFNVETSKRHKKVKSTSVATMGNKKKYAKVQKALRKKTTKQLENIEKNARAKRVSKYGTRTGRKLLTVAGMAQGLQLSRGAKGRNDRSAAAKKAWKTRKAKYGKSGRK